jgi:hypothetical protein
VVSITAYFCKARIIISRLFEYTKLKTTNNIKKNLNESYGLQVPSVIVKYTNCHTKNDPGNMWTKLVEPLNYIK